MEQKDKRRNNYAALTDGIKLVYAFYQYDQQKLKLCTDFDWVGSASDDSLITSFVAGLNKIGVPCGDSVSLRLGHARALTAHRNVIHYPSVLPAVCRYEGSGGVLPPACGYTTEILLALFKKQY